MPGSSNGWDEGKAYRLQSWRNVLDSRNDLAHAVATVRLEYETRAAALREARRVKDSEIIAEMRALIAAIGNGSAPEYQKSKDSVRKAHGTLRRERDTAQCAAEMSDDVK